jgi:hypothetical protein
MKKFIKLLAVLIVVFASTVSAQIDWGADSIVITDETQLRQFANRVNSGFVFYGQTITLKNDIDLEYREWVPIGNLSFRFQGTFDGNGNVIAGVYINSNQSWQGFFGYSAGTIKNLGVVVNITGNSNIGGLVGLHEGIIENCFALGTITATGRSVGGLVGGNSPDVNLGRINAIILNSYANVDIKGGSNAGGLVGSKGGGSIENSYAAGNVEGNDYVGGLVGDVLWHAIITNSHATGNVKGNSNVGGLLGNNGGTITNSHATGNVEGNSNVGGLSGRNGRTIRNSYATGDINGNNNIGGLVGINDGAIENCYAEGNVEGTTIIGGLVGSNNSSGTITSGTIKNSYATGNVLGRGVDGEVRLEAGREVGGLVGFNNGGSIENCYAAGNVEGIRKVGGLVGSSAGRQLVESEIKNSYATGNVSGHENIGGLVGELSGSNARITNCYATGSVVGAGQPLGAGLLHIITPAVGVGGLVGRNMGGAIRTSFATGSVEGPNNVGGLVGLLSATIENSYATGNVSGSGRNIGGLVGDVVRLFSSSTFPNITNSYATGDVFGCSFVGAFIGTTGDGVTNSYASGDVGGTGVNIGGLTGNGGSVSATTGMRTITQMRQQNTFNNWNFTTIWSIAPNINDGMPYLRASENAGTTSITRNFATRRNNSASFAGIKNGQIHLNLQAGNYTVELYNLQGRLINRANISAINGVNAIGLRTDNLANGVFVLNVKQSGVSVLRQKIRTGK